MASGIKDDTRRETADLYTSIRYHTHENELKSSTCMIVFIVIPTLKDFTTKHAEMPSAVHLDVALYTTETTKNHRKKLIDPPSPGD